MSRYTFEAELEIDIFSIYYKGHSSVNSPLRLSPHQSNIEYCCPEGNSLYPVDRQIQQLPQLS